MARSVKKRVTAGESNGRNAIMLLLAKLAGVLVATVVIAVGFALSESSAGQVLAVIAGLATSSLAYYAVVRIFWHD